MEELAPVNNFEKTSECQEMWLEEILFKVMTYIFCYSYSDVNVTLIMANFLYLNICGDPAFVNGDVVNAQTWRKPREKSKRAILRQRRLSSLCLLLPG